MEEEKAFPWFENSGIPNEKYHMVFSLYDACDGLWGMQYFEVWESQIYPFIVRQHVRDDLEVRYELFDKMRRDMAWACVEKILDMPGFFTMLAEIYKEGYFPCSWKGAIHPARQWYYRDCADFFPLGSAGWKLICVLLKEEPEENFLWMRKGDLKWQNFRKERWIP